MQEFDKGEARYGSNKKRGADIFAGGVSRLSGRRHRVRAARSATSDRLGLGADDERTGVCRFDAVCRNSAARAGGQSAAGHPDDAGGESAASVLRFFISAGVRRTGSAPLVSDLRTDG